jgi:SMODS and SLOG-associating 2TM effector domain 1
MTPQLKGVIKAAVDALGAAGPDDWKVEPTRHAEALNATAPALAEILRGSELKTLAGLFEEKDKQAIENQAKFKKTADLANWAVLLTAFFSAALLMAALLIKDAHGDPKYVLYVFGGCGVISGALGAMWVYQTREGKLLDNWVSARAEAEALRWQYFEKATSLEDPSADSPIPLLLLQFEYFRRYELDVQIKFYTKRGGEHRRDADYWMRLSSYSVAGAAIAVGLSGLDPAIVSIAALGSVATALGSFASTKDVVNQSRRNADLYGNTKDALVKLQGKLDDVRAAAAAGEREPVKQFVTAAHEQLAAEHRQWLKEAEGIQPAIDKLEQTLSDLQAKRQAKQPPQAQGDAARSG